MGTIDLQADKPDPEKNDKASQDGNHPQPEPDKGEKLHDEVKDGERKNRLPG